ncbi:MAG: hypothetical protein RLZZ598_171 [Pseudomonadota bacterium]|jgi:hypothetical protein
MAAILSIAASPANAATAYLLNCNTGTSVTGRFIYIGTYEYLGQTFNRTFNHWCPFQVEVY